MKRVGVSLVALLLAVNLGLAQELDVAELQKKLHIVAEQSIPKTVLIASQNEGGMEIGFGSGALISGDGYILTCSHVIDIGQGARVVLADGRSFEASILGRNRAQDYAVLKIEAEGLPHFDPGTSKDLALGQWVVALGHPGGPYLDQRPTFALGKIRGLHRKIPVQMLDRFYNDAIETDVPIYAGNSGGPLVGLDGRLLGLNGAILMMGEQAYATPIDQIMANYETLARGNDMEGEKLTPAEMFALMQESFGPEMRDQMQDRMGKLFGEEGMGELFSQLFGDNERMKEMLETFLDPEMLDQMGEMLGQLFGEDGGDMQKMLEQLLGGGNGGENPFGQLFGEDGGDMQKMLEQLLGGGNGGENPFGQLFGEDGGDMQKMLEQMFGQGQTPDEQTVPDSKPRAYLGIRAQETETGLRISEIAPDGPASFSKLENGDTIVTIGGTPVRTLDDMVGAIDRFAPGDVAVFTVTGSDGTSRDVKVIFGRRE